MHYSVIRGLALFVLSLFVVPLAGAQAADMAERAILGFSPDARYFAFEQFGIQDGSGFAYSDIFIVDLQSDAWVPSTPVRMRADDEHVDLQTIRGQTLNQAEPILARYDLSAQSPYRLLASVTPMEQNDQQARLTFNPNATREPIHLLHTLRLETKAMESAQDCFDMVETAGFMLSLQVGEALPKVVYEDAHIPSSRVCPADYGLSDVVVPYDSVSRRAVALVSVFQLGFEGLDRRFLVVPFDLSF